jgi:hypothetical protein
VIENRICAHDATAKEPRSEQANNRRAFNVSGLISPVGFAAVGNANVQHHQAAFVHFVMDAGRREVTGGTAWAGQVVTQSPQPMDRFGSTRAPRLDRRTVTAPTRQRETYLPQLLQTAASILARKLLVR